MAMTTLRARANRSVSVLSSDHAQRIAVKIRALGDHVHSPRNVTFESDAAFKSQSSAWLFRSKPQPSVTPGSLKPRDSKTPWFSRTIEVLHDLRLFAARRFSSE